jgi:6-phosphogluconolactonase
MPEPELNVQATAAGLAAEVAGQLIDTLVLAQAARPLAYLAVTAGSIIEDGFRAVRDSADRDRVDWSRVSLWWGDERFVAADSTDRNDTPAFEALFAAVPLEEANVHRMPASDGKYGDNVDAAADGYAAELKAAVAIGYGGDVPRFDVVLLGVGPDGHCASLFPRHPGTQVIDRSVIAVRDSPKPPPTRISLTFAALDAAAQVWFVAAGDGKAEAVALAHSGASRIEVPSAGPRGLERTVWMIDRAAAAKLPSSVYDPSADRS